MLDVRPTAGAGSHTVSDESKKLADRHIGADFRWLGPHGIGRFASEVLSRIPAFPVSGSTPILHPLDPLVQGRAVRRSGCETYFSPGFNPPVFAKVPVSFVIHDLIHLRFAPESTLAKSIFYDRVVLPAARRARFIFTVSEFSKREILDWSKLSDEQVVVVGNGVSERFHASGPRRASKYPYLLFVGARKPHKNLGRLLKAFSVAPLSRETKLCLTGDPDAALVRSATELGILDRIEFLGHLPETELPGVYRAARALVSPSLSEGFGLPVIEAMACGVPTVISFGGALQEVAGDAAELCDPLDVESISFAIQQAACNEAKRELLISRGLQRSRLFTWDGVASRILTCMRPEAATAPLVKSATA